jgi:preprotein translocase SecE subunit
LNLTAAGLLRRRREYGESIKMNEFLQKLKASFMSSIEFIKETRKELHNVSWPSRRELTGTTIVVIVSVFFFGFFLDVVDIIVGSAMNYIFHRAGR